MVVGQLEIMILIILIIVYYYTKNLLKIVNYILDKLENFFNEKYSYNIRKELKEKFTITNIKKFIKDKNYKTFDEYDNKTHFHGKHISKFNGNTDYSILLNEEELTLLKQK